MPSTDRKFTIDAPQLVSGRLRARDGVFTSLMWLLYAYLWLPMISLGAWLLGIDFAYEVMVRAGGADGLMRILAWYGIAALLIVMMVTGWSAMQRFRFRGKDRRGMIPLVSDEALLASSALAADDFALLRSGQSLRVVIDDDGQLLGVEPASGAKAA
jgi:biofilm PGA synthesis protein PgaD